MKSTVSSAAPYFIDIAANLTDCVFRGVDFKGRRVHDDDFEAMLARATEHNVQQVIITGTNLAQCEKAISLCRRYPGRGLKCTVGVHPAHCAEFLRPIDVAAVRRIVEDDAAIVEPKFSAEDSEVSSSEEGECAAARLAYLARLIDENRDVVVAVGEMGLDYAELHCCPKDLQRRYFVQQLHAFRPFGLPFLFHSRDCGMDFVSCLQQEADLGGADGATASISPLVGVVHSFNGSLDEQNALLNMGMYLSLNGSAFREKTRAEQLIRIPLSRLMLETDAPWCDIRKSHYGYAFVQTHFEASKRGKACVAGWCIERRTEPCHMIQVAEAFVGCVHAMEDGNCHTEEAPLTVDALVKAVCANCIQVFPHV